MDEHDDDRLERVRGAPWGAVGLGVALVETVDQRGDGGAVRGQLGVSGGHGVIRPLVRGRDADRLDVRGIPAARAADVGVLAVLGGGEELLALRPTHRTSHRRDDDVVEAEPVEDPHVGVAVQLVALVQPGLVDIEGVGVLHDELAAAKQTGPRTGLVAVLGLNLV